MNTDIVRAWKDEIYRQDLSEEQLLSLPTNPAGELDLTDANLQSVSGGFGGGGFGGEGFGGGFFHTTGAFVCENIVFSVNNVKNVVHTPIRITNICVNFG